LSPQKFLQALPTLFDISKEKGSIWLTTKTLSEHTLLLRAKGHTGLVISTELSLDPADIAQTQAFFAKYHRIVRSCTPGLVSNQELERRKNERVERKRAKTAARRQAYRARRAAKQASSQ
jgi:hypothetical protein